MSTEQKSERETKTVKMPHAEMKVVFLDIDGVLNSAPFVDGHAETLAMDDLEWWIEMIDPRAVLHLNRILSKTSACVVVSSTWRLRLSDDELQEVLDRTGFAGVVRGATERSSRGTRGSRVTDWLAQHPDVQHFVILDDEAEQAPHHAQFVKTTWEEGLLDAHIPLAVAILNA